MINRSTGSVLNEDEDIRQSIVDLLTTPIGTRVTLREYGSRLPLLIGKPLTDETQADAVAATAEAIVKWEPRFALKGVKVREQEGALQIALTDSSNTQIALTL